MNLTKLIEKLEDVRISDGDGSIGDMDVHLNMDGYDFHVDYIEVDDEENRVRIHLDLNKETEPGPHPSNCDCNGQCALYPCDPDGNRVGCCTNTCSCD